MDDYIKSIVSLYSNKYGKIMDAFLLEDDEGNEKIMGHYLAGEDAPEYNVLQFTGMLNEYVRNILIGDTDIEKTFDLNVLKNYLKPFEENNPLLKEFDITKDLNNILISKPEGSDLLINHYKAFDDYNKQTERISKVIKHCKVFDDYNNQSKSISNAIKSIIDPIGVSDKLKSALANLSNVIQENYEAEAGASNRTDSQNKRQQREPYHPLGDVFKPDSAITNDVFTRSHEFNRETLTTDFYSIAISRRKKNLEESYRLEIEKKNEVESKISHYLDKLDSGGLKLDGIERQIYSVCCTYWINKNGDKPLEEPYEDITIYLDDLIRDVTRTVNKRNITDETRIEYIRAINSLSSLRIEIYPQDFFDLNRIESDVDDKTLIGRPKHNGKAGELITLKDVPIERKRTREFLIENLLVTKVTGLKIDSGEYKDAKITIDRKPPILLTHDYPANHIKTQEAERRDVLETMHKTTADINLRDELDKRISSQQYEYKKIIKNKKKKDAKIVEKKDISPKNKIISVDNFCEKVGLAEWKKVNGRKSLIFKGVKNGSKKRNSTLKKIKKILLEWTKNEILQEFSFIRANGVKDTWSAIYKDKKVDDMRSITMRTVEENKAKKSTSPIEKIEFYIEELK